MFRVAAHPLCAVTPAARLALREPGLSPNDHPPKMRVQRAEGSLARVWGEEPQRLPQFALAISTTVAYNGKAAMKIGSCAILRREPGQVLTEAAVSVCWMCCGFAQSERYFFVLAQSENCTKNVFICTSFGKCV